MSDTPTREIVKSVREFEVIESDRCKLVEAANKYIEHMVWKQVMPMCSSSVPIGLTELTMDEEATFAAALAFLRREFNGGSSDHTSFEKTVEVEYEGKNKEAT